MLSNLQISKPSILWCGFLFFSQLINGFNDARNSYSDISSFWYALAFYWALAWWFITDSHEYGAGWAGGYMDMGMFLYVAWIFLIPYYLFKTRGWKALYTLLLFLGVSIGAYIVGAIVSLLIRV